MAKNYTIPNVGDKIRVIKMDDSINGVPGKDWQVQKMNGNVYEVEAIEPAPHDNVNIKLVGTGLRVIPGVDEYEIVKK